VEVLLIFPLGRIGRGTENFSTTISDNFGVSPVAKTDNIPLD
jgi:hypothetical protein